MSCMSKLKIDSIRLNCGFVTKFFFKFIFPDSQTLKYAQFTSFYVIDVIDGICNSLLDRMQGKDHVAQQEGCYLLRY